jgi:hypothetical protein
VFHDLFEWLRDVPGAVDGDPFSSWSQQFAGSLHLWSLTEGTHVVSLMLFAGTILLVDMRMLGLMFRDTPYSTLNARVLPLTIAGFILVTGTGLMLFLSNPVHYYHSVAFRIKFIFILIAAANIFWFHFMIQKNQAEWDAKISPPAPVKIAAVVSITSWVVVIVFGRLMALNAFGCESLKPDTLGYAFAECAIDMAPEEGEEAIDPDAADPDAAEPDASTPDAAPPATEPGE